jgi:glycosyltransferase involved in cell wall biosynthesis
MPQRMDKPEGSAGQGRGRASLPAVLHLTTNHQAFDVRIYLKQARTLAQAGYDVTIVAPHDRREERCGVRIHPVPTPRDRRTRMRSTTWHVYRVAASRPPGIVHMHDPELIPFGWLLKARGHTVVFDAHEDRPRQIMSKAWIPGHLRPAVALSTRLVESVSAQVFDRVVAATPAIAATFPARKTWLVQNFPIAAELVASAASPYETRPREIVFVGGINAIRGAREMVAAMEHVGASSGATLVLAGGFDPPSLEASVATMAGWSRVRALGWQSRGGVDDVLARARAGLVLFHPAPNHLAAQPNKLFEYMSAGVPVIASDFPLWRTLVAEAGAGLLVDPLDPRAIGAAIRWLLDHPQEARAMGERGRQAVEHRFNWDHEARKLLQMYSTLSR